MTTIITILILLSLFSITVSDQRVDYLAYLLTQKQQVEQAVAQMKAINHNLILNLKNIQTQGQQEMWTASALRDQHIIAIEALSHTFLSLSQKTNNCSTGSNELGQKIINLQSQLDSAKTKVYSQPACLRNDYLKANFKFYDTIAKGLKEEMTNECSGTTVSTIPFLLTGQTKYVPNTNSSAQWIYGALTPQQYTSKRDQLVSLYGAAECPLATPFLGQDNTCVVCSSGQIFDISAKKCITCAVGTVYSSTQHTCAPLLALFNSNLTRDSNYVGVPPALNPQLASCSAEKPFFDGTSCISCSLPLYFSFQNHSCQACTNDSVFDPSSKRCMTVSFFLSNLTGLQNYIGSPLSPLPYDSIKTCPSSTPFSNGKQCFSCALPKFFNFARMSCQSCPNDYSFDATSHSCTGAAGTILNSNLIENRNFRGRIPLYNSLFKSCDANTPFFNGKQCVACTLPSFFDFDTLTCSPCQNGLTFNLLVQSCEYIQQDFYTDLTSRSIYYNGNLEEVRNQIDQKKSQNPNMKVCPNTTPFYNSRNNACMGCSAGLIFDLKSNRCMSCPSGSEFDEESHICITKKVSATIQRMIMNTS